MKFNPNKTPVEVIKKGAFGGTYFRDIYSGVTGKWYKKSWKESDQLKDIRNFIVQIIMSVFSFFHVGWFFNGAFTAVHSFKD